MNRSIRFGVILMSVCVVTLASGAVFTVSAQAQKKKGKDISQMTVEEIQAEIQRLERKKQEDAAKRQQTTKNANQSGKELDAIIKQYELHLERCAVMRADNCPDVMYTLGALYYDKAKEAPVPDYNKSLKMYWQLTREYPSFPKLPEAYLSMSTIYRVASKLDSASVVLEQLVQRFPKSPRVSAAHFHLGGLALYADNFDKVEEHLKKVKQNEVDSKTWETTQNLLAQISDPKLREASRKAVAQKQAEAERAEKQRQAEAQIAAQQAEERLARVREEFQKNPIGYDPFVWETSMEVVKTAYPNAIQKDNGDNIKTLERKKTGENEPDRIYYFYKNKLFKVEVKYNVSKNTVELLIEKIASNYGTFTRSSGLNVLKLPEEKCLWKYHKNLNIELKTLCLLDCVVTVFYFDPVFMEYIEIDKEKKRDEANKKIKNDLDL